MKTGNILMLTLAGGLLVGAGMACQRPIVVTRSAPPAPAPAGLEGWQRAYPEASRALGSWVRERPESAHRFFDWDAHHTDRASVFVNWSISHRNEGLRAFAETHRGRGWEEFDVIMREHQPAAITFMAWCRRYPEAAQDLMRHPGGLDWAGHHLYAGYWR